MTVMAPETVEELDRVQSTRFKAPAVDDMLAVLR